MKQAGGGSIINLSSISGFIGQSSYATYNATKFAIRGMTKCWAIDLANDQIRVNTVCPGYIWTAAFYDACVQLGLNIEEENRRVSQMHITGRQGIPEEVAGAVAFLASDDSSFITVRIWWLMAVIWPNKRKGKGMFNARNLRFPTPKFDRPFSSQRFSLLTRLQKYLWKSIFTRRAYYMFKVLSYPIKEDSPGWPGNPTIAYEPVSLIPQGEIANTYNIRLFNHFGSHMDGPKHFNDEGPRLSEMPFETFVYDKPLLIDVPKTFNQLVGKEDLIPYEAQIKQADLLMIRSGFSKERFSNPHRYAHEGVALSAAACYYIMDSFPGLKAVAMDWISLASYAHMDDGIRAHHFLLGKFHNHFTCIIEDINLEGLNQRQLKRVYSIPLFFDVVDSSPVTVFAELKP